MSNKRTDYWIEMCEYDLEVAKSLQTSKHYLYVGFMCHQVVEKALKAYYCSISDEQPPYTHSLKRLSSLSGLNAMLSDHEVEFLIELEPLNIEARYSAYKDDLKNRLSPDICNHLITETEALLGWIKSKL